MWNHWALRACHPFRPFSDFETARQTWGILSRLFPDALSAILMPNHLHLITPQHDPVETHHKFCGLMGALSKKQRIHGLWQPLAPPKPVQDRHHLRRQIRYIALNPCRAQLCSDPFEWMWSSYRDVMGAAAAPWIKPERILRATGGSETGFQIRFHAYVSGDPSVSVIGTPFPKPAQPRTLAQEGIIEILDAAAAALRAPISDVQKTSDLRKLFIYLSHRQAWRQTEVLAQICKANPRTIQYIRRTWQNQPSERKALQHALDAAAFCLGDPRLRKQVFR